MNDHDQALRFWTEKVGCIVVSEEDNGQGLRSSIMFHTDDLDGLYQAFDEKGITVGELVNMPAGRVFNFADDENNYFAVMEKK